MKKRKIFSPYYDFKTFQYRNPYLKTPNSKENRDNLKIRVQKVKTASTNEKISSFLGSPKKNSPLLKKRSLSWNNLGKEPTFSGLRGGGDFTQKELINQSGLTSLEDLSGYKQLNSSNKNTQTSFLTKIKKDPQRVSSQNFFPLSQQQMNKKAKGDQSTLRYLLKLSNNTFYATLKHEIDTLKKEKQSLQDELTIHSNSILKIIKNQAEKELTLNQIVIQNHELGQGILKQERLHVESLTFLTNEIEELKSKSLGVLIGDDELDVILKRHKRSMKKRNRLNTVDKGGNKDAAPKSAPTMATERPKSDDRRTNRKNSRVLSMPIINDKLDGAEIKELHKKPSSTKYSESEFGSMYSSGGCSDLLSDLEIMSLKSKPSSQMSSKMNIDHRTVGTNYSSNDFVPSITDSELSMNSSYCKTRPWYKLICCK